MEQLKNLADDRLIYGCIYCGDLEKTRDHVPSKVFLDSPFPENLPVVGACENCNNSFSIDEEYLACLIECAVAGTTDPSYIRRPNIAKASQRSVSLRNKLEQAKKVTDKKTYFDIEEVRIKNVILKLARGHAAYELSQLCKFDPEYMWCKPICTMSPEEYESFDAVHIVGLFGEIGSRNTQRLYVVQAIFKNPNGEESISNLLINDWIEVQERRYRYIAIDDNDKIIIRIVIGDYLACEISWDKSSEDFYYQPDL